MILKNKKFDKIYVYKNLNIILKDSIKTMQSCFHPHLRQIWPKFWQFCSGRLRDRGELLSGEIGIIFH